MRAVLTEVAAAPPKRFAGGGYWEAMHLPDRHLTAQLLILGQPHRAQAATTQLGAQPVAAGNQRARAGHRNSLVRRVGAAGTVRP